MRSARCACCLLLVSAGCRTTVTLASPVQDLSRLQPRTLLLTDSDHSVIRMTDARLTGDTVIGTVSGQRTAIPLSRLTEVRAVVAAPARTAVLTGGVGAAALAVWLTDRWLATKPNAGIPPEVCRNPDPSSCL